MEAEKGEKKEVNLEELKKKLEECEKLKDEYLAGWQRARADLINYKKEELERVGDLIKFSANGLILKILPILDNFEIALKEVGSRKYEDTKPEEIIKGFSQIRNQILEFLRSQGVEEIKCLGEKFDPNFMEIVEQVEQKGKEAGMVIEEIQKGYKIDGRLLRPAKVKVAK